MLWFLQSRGYDLYGKHDTNVVGKLIEAFQALAQTPLDANASPGALTLPNARANAETNREAMDVPNDLAPARKDKLVPLSSVPYDRTWPQRTRLLWIVSSASSLRHWIPICKAAPLLLSRQRSTDCCAELTDAQRREAESFARDFQAARQDIRNAMQSVRDLWSAALQELPRAVTSPLNALRDGLKAYTTSEDDRALMEDLVTLEDEARRLADLPADARDRYYAGPAMPEPEIPQVEFVRLSGLSKQRVSELAKDGVPMIRTEALARKKDGRRTPRTKSSNTPAETNVPPASARPQVRWRCKNPGCPSKGNLFAECPKTCPNCGGAEFEPVIEKPSAG
ncbi:MAG: hypothetical protein ABSH20_11670 [Tepidisphaeraceae bacterium]